MIPTAGHDSQLTTLAISDSLIPIAAKHLPSANYRVVSLRPHDSSQTSESLQTSNSENSRTARDSAADILLLDCLQISADYTQIKQSTSAFPGAAVIAVVDALRAEQFSQFHAAGVAELVTLEEFANGRLQHVIGQSILSRHSSSIGDQNIGRDDVEPTDCNSVDLTTPVTSKRALLEQNRQLRVRSDLMTALRQVTLGLMNRLDLNSLLQHICDSMLKLTEADNSYVSMLDETGDFMELVATGKFDPKLVNTKHYPGQGVGGTAWQTGEIQFRKDYQNYADKLNFITDIQQACGIPVKIGNEVVAVLGIMYTRKSSQIESHLDLLQEFALLCAVAIENATLHQKTTEELKQTEAISILSGTIFASTNLNSMLEDVCKNLIDVFDGYKAHIYTLDDKQALRSLTSWQKHEGLTVPSPLASHEVLEQSICRWSIDNGELAFVPRGTDDPRESATVHYLRKKLRLGSTVCVPFIYEGRPWGGMFVHRETGRKDFTDNELSLFKVVANQTSTAIHRHNLVDRVLHQALHDSLTGLPNRFDFENRLTQALSECKLAEPNQASTVALLVLDLDSFKTINDTLGHEIGDELLKSVAARFADCLPDELALARLNADQFGVSIVNFNSRQEVETIAHRLVDSLHEPFTIYGGQVRISVSGGICYAPVDADTSGALLKNAEIAMYSAKKDSKNPVHTFSRELAEHYEQRVRMEVDLKTAIEDNQFELVYQPQVATREAKVEGVEALIRWNHPQRGLISPFQFIPVAEECGMINAIGAWVLDEACRQTSQWNQAGINLRVAVNISAQQFVLDNFVELVLGSLQKHQLPPAKLELEVTESVVMKDVKHVAARLQELREQNVKIAIDDFGTGYSSLRYLDDLPLDVLKIDRAFVNKLDQLDSRTSLAETIVLLAKQFRLQTVAEGVETATQLEKVLELGCDLVQGYFYSKPVAAAEIPLCVKNIEHQLRENMKHSPDNVHVIRKAV